jgi:hypothetical protein
MSYICVDNGRYIGEHNCNNYHYGNQTIVRPCCVEDCKKYKEQTLKVALTKYHPSYLMFRAAWGCLTDAERKIIGDIDEFKLFYK